MNDSDGEQLWIASKSANGSDRTRLSRHVLFTVSLKRASDEYDIIPPRHQYAKASPRAGV